ncbi:MFS transporter [Mucilaginibacter conchicola]|uniref:MFS transporter n=1 Tax=Mucilaginibacter conchicola TaxID=2303333 RepID=A0A372NND4_9SPHI|nr:MFS transporter [Mucilaginibacter conchicola]RFZ90466.1 MFS transporter [Mucilaginibacter conchicola]
MAATDQQIFKSWMPEWGIRIIMFLVAFPSLGLFALSMANGSAAAGYYGIEPQDVQYSMIVFYAAVVSFYSFEVRLFRFISIKNYLVLSTALTIITSYICYSTQNLVVLLIFRFIQGMGSCAATSICITLIFDRLKTERAREIGYSVFYGILLVISQMMTLVTAPLTDAFDYNTLYKVIIYAYLPGTILLYLILNNVRVNKRMPLYQLDWASFLLYALAALSLGYVLIYGQQKYWFADSSIRFAAAGFVLLLIIYALRQIALRRPYLSLHVFKYRNYCVGALLLFALYMCRGSLNVTNTYLSVVLGLDQWNLGIIMLANVSGIIAGVIISSRLTIMKRPIRFTWMCGFMLLLIFHGWMTFLFAAQADQDDFIIPLIVHGMGAGMLMVPVILFMISSVPPTLSQSASGVGVLVRFFSFCTSIACINAYSDYSKNQHYNRSLNLLGTDNMILTQRLASYAAGLESKGMAKDAAAKVSNALLAKNVSMQSQVRLSIEYYQWVCVFLLVVLILIALYPYVKKTIIDTHKSKPSAVGI